MHKTHQYLKHYYLPKPSISTSTLSNKPQQPPLSIITTKATIYNNRECILFPTYALRDPKDPHEWIVRTKGWALALKKAGPKQKVLKGITKSVAGKNSTNEISNKMFEHRFKYFLAKGKKNRHFRIEAIGSVTNAEWQQEEEDSSSSSSNCTTPHDFFTTATSSPTRNSSIMYSDDDEEEVYATKHRLWNKFQDPSPGYQLLEPMSQHATSNPPSIIVNASYPTSSSLNLNSANEEDDDDDDDDEEDDDNDYRPPTPILSPTSDQHHHHTDLGATLKSQSTGVFSGQFNIPEEQIQKWNSESHTTRIIRLRSESSNDKNNDTKHNMFFPTSYGIVNLIESNGVSVISDIDDTIKDTRVLAGARTVLTNTFFNPTRAIPEMADAYLQWYNGGASFHYVSNSPFQLVHMLYGFMRNHHFPPGSFHLRPSSGLISKLVANPGRSKRDSICGIMRDFPHRKFILIGDSGEIDLEIYTRIAIEFPGQVLKIFIRDVTTSAGEHSSHAAATKKHHRLSSKSASFPSFFTPNSSSKNNSRNSSTSNVNTITQNNSDEEEDDDDDDEDDEGIHEAASKLAELVLEPSLTGHEPIVVGSPPEDLPAFVDLANEAHQPPSHSLMQLYYRLSQARRHLKDIDIVLFKDAKELYHDEEVQHALYTFNNSSNNNNNK